MQHQEKGNGKKGLRIAIAVLSVALVLMIAFFAYHIFSPLFEKSNDNTSKINQEIASVIHKNDAGYIRDITDEMIDLTNKQREKEGLKDLKKNKNLIQVAEYKALEMAQLNYFDHNSPKYGKIDQQFLKFGGISLNKEASVIGENIAMFQNYPKNSITADLIITAWMNSPEHKENILKKDYNAIGIAVYYTSDGRCYASQEFMREK